MSVESIVAAGHPETARAAAYALECGGNAADAVLAGWLAACLAEPVLTSPGGGGFAMVGPASGPPRLYDFFAQTPLARQPGARAFPLEADFGSTRQVFHLGAGSMATPGCVAGLLRLHADMGALPLRECAAPARELAREGVPINPHAARLLTVVSELYRATPEASSLFQSRRSSEGCLREGETFHNPVFENFLDMLIAEGARWFYEGDIGRLIESTCREEGGHLRRADFEQYAVILREPLAVARRGSRIWINPPPSMGGTLMAIGLSLREPPPPAEFPFRKRDDWLHWIEPLRLMSLLRNGNPGQTLSSGEQSLLRATLQAHPDLRDALSILLPEMLPHLRSQGTTQISVMDSAGNAISMTTSNGAGSAVIPRGTGFMMNNMLGEEDLQPAGPDTWEPGRRLASMMAPVIAQLPDGARVVSGSGGSNRIRSTLLQILRHLVDRRSSLEEAVLAPRLHWENNQLHAETEAFPALPPNLEDPVIEHPIPNLFFGGAHSVGTDSLGRLHGTADPRRGGAVERVRAGQRRR